MRRDRMAAEHGSEKPRLLTREDLCRELQLSMRTLSRLLSGGKMPLPLRIGRNVRWRATDIEEWIEQGCPSINN
jgi:excisionase family DNA binding protein